MRLMQTLRLYNSRTRKKELFTAKNNHAGIYVCGITPYGVTHLGHAFVYTHFDVLGRLLRHLGYRTTYVQNLTDIDDDILKKAREGSRNWRALGEENAQKFLNDFAWLGNVQPDVYPRATDHIPDIIAFVKDILRRGLAYERNGSIYFDISKDIRFGSLSRLQYRAMLAVANERGNRPDDPEKKDPLDFVLWQKKKPGEPSWDSPWGPGRPGWHIECSAMATRYLGRMIDIHGGGGDLLFPHHESEEAQSRAAHDVPMARVWMHAGMLRYQGEKMSKSLGNLVLVENLKKRYSANTVRILLLSHHYRSSFEYAERDMKRAAETDRLFSRVWRRQSGQGAPFRIAGHRRMFYHALLDDIDTPAALAVMERLARDILAHPKKNVTDAKAFLNGAYSILGLRLALL